MSRQETDIQLDPRLVQPNAEQFTVTGDAEDSTDNGTAITRQQQVLRMALAGGTVLTARLLTTTEARAQSDEGDVNPDGDRGQRILAEDEEEEQDPTRTPNPTQRATRTPFLTWGQTATPTPTPDASPTINPSPTPDASPTTGRTVVAQVPTETPTPGETAVAMVSNRDIFRNSLAEYPGTISYTDIVGNQITVETNVNRVEPLMGINGQPILPGVYLDRPANLDPQIGMENVSINGIEVDEAVLVGTVNVEWTGYGPALYISVPMRMMSPGGETLQEARNPHFGTFVFPIFSTGAIIYAVEPSGQIVPVSQFARGEQTPISTTNEPRNHAEAIFFNQETGVLTFPTAQGIIEVKDNSQIAVSFIYNLEDIAPDMVNENGGRTPQQSIDQLMLRQNSSLLYSQENNNIQYYLYILVPRS